MSFTHPERLAALLVVAGLVAAYVAVQVRRRRAIASYTNPALHDAIAPDRVGPRRHVAPLLALAALALLVVAVAQPTRTEKVARQQGVVVLAVDVSASMTATDISPDRLQAAIDGASTFVKGIPGAIHVGLVSFDRNSSLLVSPTTDHKAVLDAIAGLQPGPGTAAGEGIYTSLDAITTTLSQAAVTAAREAGRDLPASVVLLSDGATTTGRSVDQAAQSASDLGVPVTTIAYGTPTGTVEVDGRIVAVPADTAAMQEVAAATGGASFEVTSAGELHAAYQDIQTAVGYTTEPRDVGRGLVGAAFVLLLGASAVALLWAARPL